MRKSLLVLASMVLFGCGPSANEIDKCALQTLQLAAQGYVSNNAEYIVVMNSCLGSPEWQKTPRGKELLEVIKEAYSKEGEKK